MNQARMAAQQRSNRRSSRGISPGRSMAQFGHAGHAGKSQSKAQKHQRAGINTPNRGPGSNRNLGQTPSKKKTTPVTTGGGSNIKTGPYLGSTIKRYKKTLNPLENWKRHAILSNMLKKQMIPGGKIPNYHQISAYDFDERFGLPDPVSKGLSTGYQYLTEGYKALTNPNYTLSDATSRAKEESRLNKLGIEGLDSGNMLNYQRALDYSNIKSPDDMRTFKAKYLSNGGIVNLYKYGGYLG